MCESGSISTLILDLSSYYQDYREKTRILFRRDFQTIEDVKQRISELFNISDFYLSCESFYLPESESVKILSTNSILSVKPIISNGLIEKGDILSYKRKERENCLYMENDKVNNKAEQKLSKSSSTTKGEKNGVFLNNHNKESDDRSIRLSRQTDSLNYRKFVPPQQNTQEYLEKKKINIISINVVSNTKTATTADEDNNDRIIISERLLNDVNNSSMDGSNNKSDDLEITVNNEEENLDKNDDDLNLKPPINNSKNKSSTCVGGVGTLLSALRNPSEEISSDTSFESSKRKRIRKRKRPASNKVENNEDLAEIRKSLLQRPSTLINGNPKMHVKFPDEVKINDDAAFEYLTGEYLNDLPVMDIKSLNIGDIVAFKHLISSDIAETPQTANNYILAEIMEIEKMGAEILLFNMKIIRDLNDIPEADKVQESKEEKIKSFFSVNMVDTKIVYFSDL